ncbi:MAG: ADP-L-glycero-D-manno-heptose 6-epimerase [Gammaproteobacteria bacterium]
MIVVTGGAGFIGSNIISGLNHRGITDILLVDDLTNTDKVRNIADLHIADFMDKHTFREKILTGSLNNISTVFHQGACSDTMATDGSYVMDNNYQYSKDVYSFCNDNSAQFIYASSASVYGNNIHFSEVPDNENPLNAYAYSKFQFDRYMQTQSPTSQVVGLRYFNVYGYREHHKARMASVAWHFFNQYRDNGKLCLFEGSGGYENGQQRRDFVFIEDVVAVNLFFLDNPHLSGVFNTGTGASASFNDVAVAVLNTLNKHHGSATSSLTDLHNAGLISYTPMPKALHGKYQSYTEANIQRLRQTGYRSEFASVSNGVKKYVTWLEDNCEK